MIKIPYVNERKEFKLCTEDGEINLYVKSLTAMDEYIREELKSDEVQEQLKGNNDGLKVILHYVSLILVSVVDKDGNRYFKEDIEGFLNKYPKSYINPLVEMIIEVNPVNDLESKKNES